MDINTTDSETKLNIRALGCFRIWSRGREMTGARARSSLMWKLFRFFLLNRGSAVSTERLIDVLWPDGECEDPLRALYTLVYRLRGALNEGAGEKCEFLIFNNDSYSWNGDAYCSLDLDEFTELCERAKGLEGPETLECLERAVELYDGDLFADSPRELWMLPAANTAHMSYCAAAGRLIELYIERGDFEAAARLSERSLEIDGFEETFHAGLLEALLGLGRYSLALAHYEYYSAMLYNELGVKPSERFASLSERIRGLSPETTGGVEEIMRQLDSSDSDDTGPIYCGMETFTKIYHLERRIIERTGQSVFLVCVRFEPTCGYEPDADDLAEIASLLKRVTLFGLRRSDVITQLSGTQLLLLLMNISYENCNEVVRRFERRFAEGCRSSRVRLIHESRPLRAFRGDN